MKSWPEKFLLATGNQGKLAEFRHIFSNVPTEVLSLQDYSDRGFEPPEENGETFKDNALIKARSAGLAFGLPVLADDSGLCVQALDGRPGVHSARFGGDGLSDRERCLLLLEQMNGQADRTAWFECVLCFYFPADDRAEFYTGRLEGEIGYELSGDRGFGYDPLFVLNGNRSLAEVEREEKNQISHRARAVAGLKKAWGLN